MTLRREQIKNRKSNKFYFSFRVSFSGLLPPGYWGPASPIGGTLLSFTIPLYIILNHTMIYVPYKLQYDLLSWWDGGVTVEKAVKPVTAVQDCVSTFVSSKPLDILDEGPKCFNNLVTGLRLISVSESSQCFCDLGFNFTTFLWVRSAISLILLSADDSQPCQSRAHRLTNGRLYCVYRWVKGILLALLSFNKKWSARQSRVSQV